LGQKKYHFLLHELYFSANQGGARALVGTYLGAATGYRYYDPKQKRVIVSRDVHFDENQMFYATEN
jgi:flagellar motor component MotA